MTQAKKQHFINELIGNARLDILARVPDMPEEWDGHELRRYIADTFEQYASRAFADNPRRQRAYRNTVLVNNL